MTKPTAAFAPPSCLSLRLLEPPPAPAAATPPESRSKPVRLHLSLPWADAQALAALCDESGMDRHAVVVLALRHGLPTVRAEWTRFVRQLALQSPESRRVRGFPGRAYQEMAFAPSARELLNHMLG